MAKNKFLYANPARTREMAWSSAKSVSCSKSGTVHPFHVGSIQPPPAIVLGHPGSVRLAEERRFVLRAAKRYTHDFGGVEGGVECDESVR